MDELFGLRLFVGTVADGSFSAAGRRMGLPPSSVSRRIAALERQLGIELFARTTRAMSLTEAGRLYHSYASKILADIENANSAVSALHNTPQGALNILTRQTIAARLLAPILPSFLQRYRGLKAHIHVIDRSPDTVPEGVDLMIRCGLGRDSSLRSRKIMDTRRVLVASPGYIERHGLPTTVPELQNHNCLVFSTAAPVVWRFRASDTHEIRPNGNLEVNDVDALCAALAGGLGVSILHEWMVRDELQRGTLIALLRDYEVTTGQAFNTPISAIYHARLAKSVKVRLFLDFLKEHLAQPGRPGRPESGSEA
jgi:DNA-binding transcriptional LysR family regulator